MMMNDDNTTATAIYMGPNDYDTGDNDAYDGDYDDGDYDDVGGDDDDINSNFAIG